MKRIHCKKGHNKERNKTDLPRSYSKMEATVLNKVWFGFILIDLWEFITQTVRSSSENLALLLEASIS